MTQLRAALSSWLKKTFLRSKLTIDIIRIGDIHGENNPKSFTKVNTRWEGPSITLSTAATGDKLPTMTAHQNDAFIKHTNLPSKAKLLFSTLIKARIYPFHTWWVSAVEYKKVIQKFTN